MKLCPKCERQVTRVWGKNSRPALHCFNCDEYDRPMTDDEIKAAEEEIREGA